MLDQEKEFPNDSGRPLNYNNFTDKKQNAWLLLRNSAFCIFCIEMSLYQLSFRVRGLQMTINFALE